MVEMDTELTEFESYSYRTSSRFGSRVRVSVQDGEVTVTGPRVASPVYRVWIAAQVVLFWSVMPVLLIAVVLGKWWYLVVAFLLILVHWLVGTMGAVGFWELENLNAFSAGTLGETAGFSLGAVRRVMTGRGWARNGLWLAIPPIVPLINQVAQGLCVSFEVLEGGARRAEVYALHMRTEAQARALSDLLSSHQTRGHDGPAQGTGSGSGGDGA